AVIGLGNRLLADEGAGLRAVELLKKELEDKNRNGTAAVEVDVIEAGTPGMNLLHQLDERRKVIFIDAGNCGISAGEYRRFTPGEVISLKKEKGYSLHEFDLMGFIEFAGKMGISRDVEIVIYCIQAAEVAMSQRLSPVVQKSLPMLVRDVYDEVKSGSYRTSYKNDK
ncbi:MAG: hydrogenase maturation protease, partial [bacterium]|nr:hydrogenase maturation protease [bacterium]